LREAVKHEFDPARDPRFFEDSKAVGSTVLGFSTAFPALDLYRASDPAKSPLLFPILIAAIPRLDRALAVMRRVRERSSPPQGERRHFYDLLLVARGWSARKVARMCYGLTAFLTFSSWLILRSHFSQALFSSGVRVTGLFGAAAQLASLRSEKGVRIEPASEKLRGD
jgi:hypothetical protein